MSYIYTIYYIFNVLGELSHGKNPPPIPPIVQDKMLNTTSSIKVVLTDFWMPILSNIGGEFTREGLIKLHCLISGNTASVASNLRGGRHGHLVLTITLEDYMA